MTMPAGWQGGCHLRRHGDLVTETPDGAKQTPVVGGEPIRVLVVDDHALFRRGLEMVLAQEPDIEVSGEAEAAPSALQKTVETTPDMALMDVRMPKRGGVAAATAIKEAV